MNESKPALSPAPWTDRSLAKSPLILHVFSTFAVGGPQRRFASIANHFGPRFRHVVIAADHCTQARALLAADAPCDVRVPPFQRRSLAADVIRSGKEIARINPDVLVTYNWGAIDWAAAGLLRSVRHIHIEDGFGPEEAQRQLRRRVAFRRAVLNWRSTIVLPSQTLYKIATRIWRLNPRRLRYLPNGIDCARFKPRATELKDKFAGSGPIIGTVAALRREKAIDRLIEAFTSLRAKMPARLVIAGDGPERTALEGFALARGLRDCVTFTGNLTNPEETMAAFDIFALSSDTEQMPLSLLEAMASGLPVVSTDVGDVRSILPSENRPFVVSRSADELTEAFIQLIEQPALAAALGKVNRTCALAEFDQPKMFAAYERLFSDQAA